ncbi:hypothetical protein [Streptomyces buecherae]|uniref:hypothetical protein n=1 Tax=Streptomyces buecherae TaxID=2763006 RepID=UPI003789E953
MVATDGPQDVVLPWRISAADLPAAVLDAPASARVYLLPDASVDGVAVYRDDAAGIVKTLRHRDVDIDFAVPREGRRYFSEFSAAVVVTTVCVAVVSTLTADLIKNIAVTTWQRARSALGADLPPEQVGEVRVTVKVAEIVRTDEETVIRGLEVTGRLADVEGLLQTAVSDPATGQLLPVDPSGPEGTAE